MSSPLALAAVTGVLQYLLSQVCNAPGTGLGGVNVTAYAPDLITDVPSGNNEVQRQLNLFLHQVTPNAAYRNVGLPSLAADGATRLKNPPLALDLHYLLTAYSNAETEAEAMLGYAIMMLFQYPMLARSDINLALQNIPNTNPLYQVLSGSNLGSQFEMIKITPATLGREEMAWLWTALKADYRPTFPFQVSVVLIESPKPAQGTVPVLSTAIAVQPSLPQAIMINAPNGLAAAAGNPVTITGQALGSINQLLLTYSPQQASYKFAPGTVTASSIRFNVPEDPTKLPAGPCTLTAQVVDGSGNVLQSSNSVEMPIAASIAAAPAPVITSNATETTVTLSTDPQVNPSQSIALVLGNLSAPAQPFTTAGGPIAFQFAPPLKTGSYIALLQVDGVLGPVTFTTKPPAITGPTLVVT
ncbi:MAG TPA: DUF4255 domain-containing protein [Acidobacteriaceae bacterium]